MKDYNECETCKIPLVSTIEGFWVCRKCGLCSDDPVYADGQNRHSEDEYRKNHRKGGYKIREMPANKKVMIRTTIYDELKEFLKEWREFGKHTSQVRFISEAISIYIDECRKEMDTNGIRKKIAKKFMEGIR